MSFTHCKETPLPALPRQEGSLFLQASAWQKRNPSGFQEQAPAHSNLATEAPAESPRATTQPMKRGAASSGMNVFRQSTLDTLHRISEERRFSRRRATGNCVSSSRLPKDSSPWGLFRGFLLPYMILLARICEPSSPFPAHEFTADAPPCLPSALPQAVKATTAT